MVRRMKAAGEPGITPFELARTPERADRIMDRWGEDGRPAGRRSLLLDFPFLTAYTTFNVALTSRITVALPDRGANRLAAAAPAMAATQIAAGACDAIENTALLGVLAGRSDRLPALARRAAIAKFALLGAGATYGVLGLAAAVRHTRPRGRAPGVGLEPTT